MDMKSIFAALLRGANPDHPDEAIQAKADQLSQHPDAASALQPLTGTPDMSPKFADANSTPSNFDVKTSDNTVTQEGKLPMSPISSPVPSPSGMPPFGGGGNPVSGVTGSWEALTPSKIPPPVSKEPAGPPAPPETPPPLETPSNDNDARNAMMQKAIENRKNATLPIVLAGAGDAIATGLKAFGVNAPTDKQDKLVALAKQNFDESKNLFEEKLRRDPSSDVSQGYRDMVAQIAPAIAKDPTFQNMSAQDIGDRLPLVDTMMKAKASEDARKAQIAMAASYKDINLGLRQDQQQDKLEQQAKQMVANLRGDKSLARAEEQRDAAAVAVNRLKEIQASGKGLNPVDYTDILGQIYKARTGAAPGEEVLKNIRQSTAAGKLGAAYTFITGQQAPATTQDIANSLMTMAQSMGKQADAFHQGYMNAHLIKPTGLEDERWQPILNTGRGMSFTEATKQNSQPSEKQSGGNDPLGLR